MPCLKQNDDNSEKIEFDKKSQKEVKLTKYDFTQSEENEPIFLQGDNVNELVGEEANSPLGGIEPEENIRNIENTSIEDYQLVRDRDMR